MEDDDTEKNAIEFMQTCGFFIVFFEIETNEFSEQLKIHHYVGYQSMPTPQESEEIIEEVNSDPDFSIFGEVDNYRVAIVEINPVDDTLDSITEEVARQLMKDLGYID